MLIATVHQESLHHRCAPVSQSDVRTEYPGQPCSAGQCSGQGLPAFAQPRLNNYKTIKTGQGRGDADEMGRVESVRTLGLWPRAQCRM